MRREFLQNLQAEQPLSKQSIDAIMAENGKDIEATRALFADYDSLKQQLATAQQTIHTLEENADKALAEKVRQMEFSFMLQQQEEMGSVKSQVSKLTQDSGKLELRLSQMEENGSGKITTSTGYRFDSEGLYISKSGEEMENKLDNTGMYVRRSGQVILQANNRGVEATDVTVHNYLTVGGFSRLEDYNSGTDNQRTACFYIGGTYDGI